MYMCNALIEMGFCESLNHFHCEIGCQALLSPNLFTETLNEYAWVSRVLLVTGSHDTALCSVDHPHSGK